MLMLISEDDYEGDDVVDYEMLRKMMTKLMPKLIMKLVVEVLEKVAHSNAKQEKR